MGSSVDREDDGEKAGRFAQYRRIAAQRYFLRPVGPADDLDSAFLPRLFAARDRRAFAESDRSRRPGDDGGAVLGPRRRNPAAGRRGARGAALVGAPPPRMMGARHWRPPWAPIRSIRLRNSSPVSSMKH